jgi:hypothetical protein
MISIIPFNLTIRLDWNFIISYYVFISQVKILEQSEFRKTCEITVDIFIILFKFIIFFWNVIFCVFLDWFFLIL